MKKETQKQREHQIDEQLNRIENKLKVIIAQSIMATGRSVGYAFMTSAIFSFSVWIVLREQFPVADALFVLGIISALIGSLTIIYYNRKARKIR